MRDLASRFFVITKEGEREVNHEIDLSSLSKKEKVFLLLQIIEIWNNIFCSHDSNDVFGYHVYAQCPRCASSQKVLNKLFGDCRKFENFPFVKVGRNYLNVFSLKGLNDYVK